MNQLPTTKRKEKRNAKPVERPAKKPNQTVRKTRKNNPMKSPFTLFLLSLLALSPVNASERPNVLLIAVDDLNDWVGCLGGHSQTHTPNIDRLAARGVLFTNAHCQGTMCNPSRISLLWGRRPSSTGFYSNRYPVSKEPTFLSRMSVCPRILRSVVSRR